MSFPDIKLNQKQEDYQQGFIPVALKPKKVRVVLTKIKSVLKSLKNKQIPVLQNKISARQINWEIQSLTKTATRNPLDPTVFFEKEEKQWQKKFLPNSDQRRLLLLAKDDEQENNREFLNRISKLTTQKPNDYLNEDNKDTFLYYMDISLRKFTTIEAGEIDNTTFNIFYDLFCAFESDQNNNITLQNLLDLRNIAIELVINDKETSPFLLRYTRKKNKIVNISVDFASEKIVTKAYESIGQLLTDHRPKIRVFDCELETKAQVESLTKILDEKFSKCKFKSKKAGLETSNFYQTRKAIDQYSFEALQIDKEFNENTNSVQLMDEVITNLSNDLEQKVDDVEQQVDDEQINNLKSLRAQIAIHKVINNTVYELSRLDISEEIENLAKVIDLLIDKTDITDKDKTDIENFDPENSTPNETDRIMLLREKIITKDTLNLIKDESLVDYQDSKKLADIHKLYQHLRILIEQYEKQKEYSTDKEKDISVNLEKISEQSIFFAHLANIKEKLDAFV